MKIALSVFGRFHIFDTAREFSKKKILNQFFTTYPESQVDNFQIHTDNCYTYPFIEVLNRLHGRFLKKYISNLFFRKMFDKKIASNLTKDNDFYIAWGGYSYGSMKKAKNHGVTTIVERGSAHPLFIEKILKEEFEKFGIQRSTSKNKLLDWDLQTIEMADFIMVPSTFAKRTYVEHGTPEHKILVNPYGVDLKSFRQEEIKDDVFRVIYTGKGSFQKGYHYLLQAFYELDLPNSELWHLGKLSDEIRSFVKKYKSPKIIHLGHKPQSQLYKFYSQGSVFVLPSIQDGFGMVLSQAMACGLPIIATTNTGGEDLITRDGEEGFVIAIRSVDQLKEKILYLYENKSVCRKMGEKAKIKVSKGLSWDEYGDRYMQILNNVFENKNSLKSTIVECQYNDKNIG